jgi:hypothetical protein
MNYACATFTSISRVLYVWTDDFMSRLRQKVLREHLAPELKRSGLDGSIVVQARQTPRIQSVVAGIKDQTSIVSRPENN